MLINIANVIMKINCPRNHTLTELIREYIIEDGKEDAVIDIKVNNNIPLPTEQVYGPYKNYYYSEDKDGTLNTYAIPDGFDRCLLSCKVSPDGKSASIDIIDLTDTIVEFNLGEYMITAIGLVFIKLILKYNGFVIHGSSISYNNDGIIFSAKSGTGKSTQTKLWMDNLDDVILVNDDTPAVTFEDEDVYLNGTPFAGTTGLNKNVKVPLKAVVFIERADKPYIERLSFKDAIPRFMDEMKKSLVSDNISLCVDYAAKLMEKVPVYLLHCNMEKESVEVLKNQLEI